jgi:hypothetical protein
MPVKENMSDDNLQLCSKCKIGKMRPTGKVGTDGDIENPFSETSDARRYQCDSCGHVQFNANQTENVRIGENLNLSVEKADKKEL